MGNGAGGGVGRGTCDGSGAGDGGVGMGGMGSGGGGSMVMLLGFMRPFLPLSGQPSVRWRTTKPDAAKSCLSRRYPCVGANGLPT